MVLFDVDEIMELVEQYGILASDYDDYGSLKESDEVLDLIESKLRDVTDEKNLLLILDLIGEYGSLMTGSEDNYSDIKEAPKTFNKIRSKIEELVQSSPDVMLENGEGEYGVPEEVKSEIMTLINEYAEYFVRSITDDNFPDVKVNKKKQELFGLIESL